MMERARLTTASMVLVAMAAMPAGSVRADACEGTWVGGIELPDRYLFLVADLAGDGASGTLGFADGERASVTIDACTADSVRLAIEADGTDYVFHARLAANEMEGRFSPREDPATAFPFRLHRLYPVRTETLAALEGTYVFDDHSRLKVRAVGSGYLRAYAMDTGRFRNLYPASDVDFREATDLSRPDGQVRVTFGAGTLEHGTRGRARRVENRPLPPSWTQQDGRTVIELTPGTHVDLLRVTAGAFEMGSAMTAREAEHLFGLDDGTIRRFEHPARRTRITKDYWLARSEVTNAQFRAFVDEEAYITTAELEESGLLWIDGQFTRVPGASWRHPGRVVRPNDPVVMISWRDAAAFCDWLSRRTGRDVRLPTEAEWEYACTDGRDALYGYGDDPTALARYAWYSANAAGEPHEVETREPDARGFHDMHGNVWEWCADWYAAIDPTVDAVDPTGPEHGDEKVIRGGSWINGAFDCRSSYRAHDDPGLAEPHFGFRICATALDDGRSSGRTDTGR